MRSSTETILASLNTHGGRGADGRRYGLEAACRQFKADIIVLQEVWRPHDEPNPVDEIATALGAEPLWTDLIRDVNLGSVGIADERARGRCETRAGRAGDAVAAGMVAGAAVALATGTKVAPGAGCPGRGFGVLHAAHAAMRAVSNTGDEAILPMSRRRPG